MIDFWIVFGVAGFGLALALQMRVLVAKVLRFSVAAKYPKLHHNDVRAVVRASPQSEAPAVFSAEFNDMRDWVRDQHPAAVGHLARARRWSVILPLVILVVAAVGRFKLGAF